MASELSTGNEEDEEDQSRRELSGTEPVTDYASKQVMIAAERRDVISISDVVQWYSSEEELPEQMSVIRRQGTFYGPKLVLHADVDEDRNYLLTAPGPDAYLHLWRTNADEFGLKESNSLVAEVKARIAEGGDYKLCPDCGKPFQDVEHERLAAIGECPNL